MIKGLHVLLISVRFSDEKAPAAALGWLPDRMSLQFGERNTDGRSKIAPLVAFSSVRLEERSALG